MQDQVIQENKHLMIEIQRLQAQVDIKEAEKIQLLAAFQKEKSDITQRHQSQLIERDIKIKELLQMNLQLESTIKQREEIIKMNADVSD